MKKFCVIILIMFMFINMFGVITHSQLDEAKVLEKGESKHGVVFGFDFMIHKSSFIEPYSYNLHTNSFFDNDVISYDPGMIIPVLTMGYSFKAGYKNNLEFSFEHLLKGPNVKRQRHYDWYNDKLRYIWSTSNVGISTDFGVKKQIFKKDNMVFSYKGNFGLDAIFGGPGRIPLRLPIVIKNSLLIGSYKNNQGLTCIPYFQNSFSILPGAYLMYEKGIYADFSPGLEFVYSYTSKRDVVFNVGTFFQYTFEYIYYEENIYTTGVNRFIDSDDPYNDISWINFLSESIQFERSSYSSLFKIGLSFSISKIVKKKK